MSAIKFSKLLNIFNIILIFSLLSAVDAKADNVFCQGGDLTSFQNDTTLDCRLNESEVRQLMQVSFNQTDLESERELINDVLGNRPIGVLSEEELAKIKLELILNVKLNKCEGLATIKAHLNRRDLFSTVLNKLKHDYEISQRNLNNYFKTKIARDYNRLVNSHVFYEKTDIITEAKPVTIGEFVNNEGSVYAKKPVIKGFKPEGEFQNLKITPVEEEIDELGFKQLKIGEVVTWEEPYESFISSDELKEINFTKDVLGAGVFQIEIVKKYTVKQ